MKFLIQHGNCSHTEREKYCRNNFNGAYIHSEKLHHQFISDTFKSLNSIYPQFFSESTNMYVDGSLTNNNVVTPNFSKISSLLKLSECWMLTDKASRTLSLVIKLLSSFCYSEIILVYSKTSDFQLLCLCCYTCCKLHQCINFRNKYFWLYYLRNIIISTSRNLPVEKILHHVQKGK